MTELVHLESLPESNHVDTERTILASAKFVRTVNRAPKNKLHLNAQIRFCWNKWNPWETSWFLFEASHKLHNGNFRSCISQNKIDRIRSDPCGFLELSTQRHDYTSSSTMTPGTDTSKHMIYNTDVTKSQSQPSTLNRKIPQLVLSFFVQNWKDTMKAWKDCVKRGRLRTS